MVDEQDLDPDPMVTLHFFCFFLAVVRCFFARSSLTFLSFFLQVTHLLIERSRDYGKFTRNLRLLAISGPIFDRLLVLQAGTLTPQDGRQPSD